MKSNKEQAQKFWDNGTKKVGEKFKIDLDNQTICEEDIKESIRRAFRDLTVRTMKKRNGNTVNGLDNLAQNCEFLQTQIKNWFLENSSKEKFDLWHEENCVNVVEFLKEYYEEKDCTIGKAQKIINMSFKNLYALCCKKNIEKKYEKYFEFCHVPLDSFILEWFYRQCKKEKEKIAKGKICSWSAISEYGKDKDTYVKGDSEIYTYLFFQKFFRKWFADISTPLQAEFVIWSTIQKELASEGFLFSLEEDISSNKKEEIKKLSLEEKIKLIKDKLD